MTGWCETLFGFAICYLGIFGGDIRFVVTLWAESHLGKDFLGGGGRKLARSAAHVLDFCLHYILV